MKKILLFISCLLLFSCSEKKEKPAESSIGEYLYIDQYSCIHVKQRCIKLTFSDEGESPNYMVKRLSLGELRYIGRTCSNCVSDEIYKELQNIVENNNYNSIDSVVYE